MIGIHQWDATCSMHVANLCKKVANILLAGHTANVSIIDVGSNVGKFVELLQEYGIVVDDAVMCDIVPQLTEYTTHKFPQFQSINAAVSDTDGEEIQFINLIDHENNLGLSRIISNVGVEDAHRMFSVKTISISTIVERYNMAPNIIKIDAEGYDLIVLNSVLQYMEAGGACRPLIIFECCGSSDTAEFVARLENLDYKVATYAPMDISRDVFAIPNVSMNSDVQQHLADMPYSL